MSDVLTAPLSLEDWRCTPPLDPAQHHAIRREMALDGFKWDAQVGDVCALAPFALLLPASVYRELAVFAEALAGELHAAERALCTRPDLWPALGLPAEIVRALAGDAPWTPAAARAIRFDFHPTTEGWRISEANSDVPGGYTEATRFTNLMAETCGGRPAGDPTAALTRSLLRAAGAGDPIALVAASGVLEDQQVILHLADALARLGVGTFVGTPDQIVWQHGRAHARRKGRLDPVSAVFRFWQGEWMPRFPDGHWRPYFRGGETPVCNPGQAVLSESKRLPLLWPALELSLPTWRQLLPETRPASQALTGHSWLLKAAYSNNGEAVHDPRGTPAADFALALGQALFRPRRWAAQRAFRGLPLLTPLGPAQVCLGVYVIDGRASGIYGRISLQRIVDYRSIDTAVLLAA